MENPADKMTPDEIRTYIKKCCDEKRTIECEAARKTAKLDDIIMKIQDDYCPHENFKKLFGTDMCVDCGYFVKKIDDRFGTVGAIEE